jgi:hypothetical protein
MSVKERQRDKFLSQIKKPQGTSYSGAEIARLVSLSNPWQRPVEKSLKSISCLATELLSQKKTIKEAG